MALKFVYENKNRLDCSRITINGESAGGASVALLLLNDEAVGYIDGAVAQSGGTLTGLKVTRCRLMSSDVDCSDIDDQTKMLGCDLKKALLVIQQEIATPQKSTVEFKLFVNHFSIAISQPQSQLRLSLFKMLIL